jgi:hypothetical protein
MDDYFVKYFDKLGMQFKYYLIKAKSFEDAEKKFESSIDDKNATYHICLRKPDKEIREMSV